jgi:hypothetical protein
MKLFTEGRIVKHPHGQFEVEHPIVDARELGGTVLVLCDYMSFPGDRPARNLFAYNHRGEVLWRAEDIGCGSTDAYANIQSEDPLVVGNFAGYECKIDLTSGRVTASRFTK